MFKHIKKAAYTVEDNKIQTIALATTAINTFNQCKSLHSKRKQSDNWVDVINDNKVETAAAVSGLVSVAANGIDLFKKFSSNK